jgi:hypothetical protein
LIYFLSSIFQTIKKPSNGEINSKLSIEEFTLFGGHLFTLTEIYSDSAKIRIMSKPTFYTLVVGEEAKLDLNYDDIADISITITSIDYDKKIANINIKKIDKKESPDKFYVSSDWVNSINENDEQESYILSFSKSASKNSGKFNGGPLDSTMFYEYNNGLTNGTKPIKYAVDKLREENLGLYAIPKEFIDENANNINNIKTEEDISEKTQTSLNNRIPLFGIKKEYKYGRYINNSWEKGGMVLYNPDFPLREIIINPGGVNPCKGKKDLTECLFIYDQKITANVQPLMGPYSYPVQGILEYQYSRCCNELCILGAPVNCCGNPNPNRVIFCTEYVLSTFDTGG